MLKIYPYCVLFRCNNESNLLINSVREINNKRQYLIHARKPSWIIIVFQHIHGARLIFNDEDECDVDSQVDDFGHRISRDPAAKMRESHRILQESTGNHRKNPKNFRPKYCFQKITGITQNRQLLGRVVRPGLWRQLHKPFK